jgi:hypothetical protein
VRHIPDYVRPPGWAATRQRMTKRQLLSLRVLKKYGWQTARVFARRRWPVGFKQTSHGGHDHDGLKLNGVAVSMKAGALLRAFVRMGLVRSELRFDFGDDPPRLHYRLTPRGDFEPPAAESRRVKVDGRVNPDNADR